MIYKNITKKDLFLSDIGIVKSGKTVEVKDKINNPNFEEVADKKPTPSTPSQEDLKKSNEEVNNQ